MHRREDDDINYTRKYKKIKSRNKVEGVKIYYGLNFKINKNKMKDWRNYRKIMVNKNRKLKELL